MAAGAEDLVGRGRELSTLDAALDALPDGCGGVLAVTGDPGIGKSRLLEELAARAGERGYAVRSGRVVRDAGAGPPLGVLPAGPGRRPWPRVVERLAGDAPLLLAVDDVHVADATAAAAIGALLRRPPREPVLLALALRPRQLPRALASALDRAQRADAVERLALEPLDAAASRALLGPGLEPGVAREVLRLGAGNPFHLLALAREVRLASGSPAAQVLEDVVPAGVAAILAAERAPLSHSARRLLDAAAVIGDPFDPEHCAGIAGVARADVLAALDELVARDLVRATGVPRRFRFRHPMLRRAAHLATPARWRPGAHRHAASVLTAAGAPATELAQHVASCARPGDLAAVALLGDAAAAIAHRRPERAARWYATSLRLLPAGPEHDERRVGLLEARAGVLAATGRLEEARKQLLAVHELLRDDAARVRVTTAAARIETLMGRHAAGHGLLIRQLRDLHELRSEDAAEMLIELTRDALRRGDVGAMSGWAGPALAVAQQVGDRPLVAAAAAVLALASAYNDDRATAEARHDEAAEAVASLTDAQLAPHPDALDHLVMAEVLLDRHRQVLAHADRGLAIARSFGDDDTTAGVSYDKALSLWTLGRVGEGRALAEAMAHRARSTGNPRALLFALTARSVLAITGGDLALARADVEEILALAVPVEPGPLAALPAALRGWALLEAGDAPGAVEAIQRGSAAQIPALPRRWQAPMHEVLARAWLALDDLEQARRCASRAQAAATPARLSLVCAWRAQAAVALGAGEHDRATALAREAAELAQRIGAPVEAARARIVLGQALGEAGRISEAADELAAAASALDACRAEHFRDLARRELHRHGGRFTRPASLSAREEEVARLVGDGATNREIAAALVIADKTVESHIRNIFRKLDVTAREQIAPRLRAAPGP